MLGYERKDKEKSGYVIINIDYRRLKDNQYIRDATVMTMSN